MKFSTQEEYGIRLLLRIAKDTSDNGMTIRELSQLEGIGEANVAKILRLLRLSGFVESSRGQFGGYKLSYHPKDIKIGDVLTALGGKLYQSSFCSEYSGNINICTHSIDCSIRSLWKIIQFMLDNLLNRISLADLSNSEKQVDIYVNKLYEEFESYKK